MEMEKMGIFGLNEVFDRLVDARELYKQGLHPSMKAWKEIARVPFAGNDGKIHYVRLTSIRYHVFKRSHVCAKCGIEGKQFHLERAKYNYVTTLCHLNLYAIQPDGSLMLMTQDHIIPVAKGGETTLDNLQTLCDKCNTEKADNIE